MKKMFSTLGGAVVVAVLCAALSFHYQASAFETLIWISLGWFCYGKLALAMFFAQGYGVKRGVTIIVGMPAILAGIFAILMILVAWLLISTYQPSTVLPAPATIAKIQAFGWSAAIGVGMALCHWYLYARTAYFYQSEYNIRQECRSRGETQESTEAAVAEYRRLGILA